MSESNDKLQQHIAALEKNLSGTLVIIAKLSGVVDTQRQTQIGMSEAVLMLWNNQIAFLKMVTKTSPNLDDLTKQTFLSTIAQMERQTEHLEAMLAALKDKPKTPPA